jgi:hypothetical protein
MFCFRQIWELQCYSGKMGGQHGKKNGLGEEGEGRMNIILGYLGMFRYHCAPTDCWRNQKGSFVPRQLVCACSLQAAAMCSWHCT